MKYKPTLAVLLMLAGCGDEPPPAGGNAPVVMPVPAGQRPVTTPGVPAPATTAPPQAAAARAALEARFAEFDVLQQSLKTRYNNLAFELRQTTLAGAEVRAVNEKMARAGYLLKLPKQIGAFTDIADIEREQRRLEEAAGLLADVEALVGAGDDEAG